MEVCEFKSSLDSQVERQYRLTVMSHARLSPYLLYTRVVCSNKAFAVMWSLDSAMQRVYVLCAVTKRSR